MASYSMLHVAIEVLALVVSVVHLIANYKPSDAFSDASYCDAAFQAIPVSLRPRDILR